MKGVVCLLLFLLMVGVAAAALSWDEDEIDEGDEWLADEEYGGDVVDVDSSSVSDSGGEFVYTQNFYIALGVGGVGVLIVGYLVYSFFRRPKNRWKK